ncbi:MAG TPA: thioredoxin family protein [Myxococcota bacterium]|nr:thioredoxin family protein [Myxococcota bacterium]
MDRPRIVSRAEWLLERKQHLANEKRLTRLHEQLAAERRRLPWVRVEKRYVFDGPDGAETLAELFGERSQLIVNHFMFGPDWKQGCPGCSFGADNIEGGLVHLRQRDVSYVAVSRAPLSEIEAFKKRMGWSFKWVSSGGNDFNYDFHVSFRPEELGGRGTYNFEEQEIRSDELPGLSVFAKSAEGEVFHTYSAYARGAEGTLATYTLLDMTPLGRDEQGDMTNWIRHHDRYEERPAKPVRH